MGVNVAAPSRLNLYLPHPESRLSHDLIRGSAIVGLPSDGKVRIYFEGNSTGAANLMRYAWRAAQATARMLYQYPAGYPTRARDEVDPREVVEIGSIDSLSGRIELTADPRDLLWWIDETDLSDLTCAGGSGPRE